MNGCICRARVVFSLLHQLRFARVACRLTQTDLRAPSLRLGSRSLRIYTGGRAQRMALPTGRILFPLRPGHPQLLVVHRPPFAVLCLAGDDPLLAQLDLPDTSDCVLLAPSLGLVLEQVRICVSTSRAITSGSSAHLPRPLNRRPYLSISISLRVLHRCVVSRQERDSHELVRNALNASVCRLQVSMQVVELDVHDVPKKGEVPVCKGTSCGSANRPLNRPLV